VVESASLEAIQACTREEIWWGDSTAIYADCVDLKIQIDKVLFIHCPTEANGVAHELARVCYLNKASCNWADEPPSFILVFYLKKKTVQKKVVLPPTHNTLR
jgi:hypothetical protein